MTDNIEKLKIEAEERIGEIAGYYGMYFSYDGAKPYWKITCPCGRTVTYPINGLPEVDTPMPCGNPKHWAVKYSPGRSKS